MNTEIIKSETINRESLDLDSVLIDEIIDKPVKMKESNQDEKHKIEILAQTIIMEEATDFKRKKEIQKAKKESCCYRWCNYKCCYNRKQETHTDDYCDDIFWYWYWCWFFNNTNSYSNRQNNNSNCCDCNCCHDCSNWDDN